MLMTALFLGGILGPFSVIRVWEPVACPRTYEWAGIWGV